MIESIDFKGNTFESKTAMCKAYGLPISAYNRRMSRGWSQEKALTTPLKNGKGYDNYVNMCKLYRKNHSNEIRENQRKYREKNKDKMRIYQKNYRERKEREREEKYALAIQILQQQFASVN